MVDTKIAIGMDLRAATAVCYAVFAGEGEPREKHIEFLEEFNRNLNSGLLVIPSELKSSAACR